VKPLPDRGHCGAPGCGEAVHRGRRPLRASRPAGAAFRRVRGAPPCSRTWRVAYDGFDAYDVEPRKRARRGSRRGPSSVFGKYRGAPKGAITLNGRRWPCPVHANASSSRRSTPAPEHRGLAVPVGRASRIATLSDFGFGEPRRRRQERGDPPLGLRLQPAHAIHVVSSPSRTRCETSGRRRKKRRSAVGRCPPACRTAPWASRCSRRPSPSLWLLLLLVGVLLSLGWARSRQARRARVVERFREHGEADGIPGERVGLPPARPGVPRARLPRSKAFASHAGAHELRWLARPPRRRSCQGRHGPRLQRRKRGAGYTSRASLFVVIAPRLRRRQLRESSRFHGAGARFS